jgi:hypothetical protein
VTDEERRLLVVVRNRLSELGTCLMDAALLDHIEHALVHALRTENDDRADASAATYDELAEELELGLVVTPEVLRERARAIRRHAAGSAHGAGPQVSKPEYY